MSSYQHFNTNNDELVGLNFLPSPAPTEAGVGQLTGDYGSLLQKGSSGSLIQMQDSGGRPNENGDDEVDDGLGRKQGGRRRHSLYGLLGAIVAVLALLAMLVFHSSNSPSLPKEDEVTTNSVHEQHGYIFEAARALSGKHPVEDLKVPLYKRPDSSQPNWELFQDTKEALPTNAWYQNLLLTKGEPTPEQRVYPVPYVLDMVGPIPGLRLHHSIVTAGAKVVQLTQVLAHGLTLGAATKKSLMNEENKEQAESKRYSISKMTPLGITLEWKDHSTPTHHFPLTYSSSIVRGMPFATMQYNSKQQQQVDLQQGAATKAMELERIKALQPTKALESEEKHAQKSDDVMLPTVASEIPINAPPLLDGKTELVCPDSGDSKPQLVNEEIQLIFGESDYTWLVFVSRPVRVQCVMPPAQEMPEFVPGRVVPSRGVAFALQFLDNHNEVDKTDLIIRLALANDCTYGGNPSTCGLVHKQKMNQTAYTELLREHADLYPGPDTDVGFDFVKNETTGLTAATHIKFNWNVQSMKNGEYYDDNIDNHAGTTDDAGSVAKKDYQAKLLMFALPHHQDMIEESTALGVLDDENQESSFPTYTVPGDKHSDSDTARFCTPSLLGPVCLVEGSTWSLREANRWTGFRAPRPPHNTTLAHLAKAFKDDIKYKLPSYYERGAGDTYFSGKMLAKFGRILIIGEELNEVCSRAQHDECHGLDFPSLEGKEFQNAIERLRSNVEIWINGTGETPFVYDSMWGGLVSCGCAFEGDDKEGICRNKYPDCPAFQDPGLNFGNAFYNDHHFHLGYHIYAAAVVAHFDPEWGRNHFEQVLLLIRDIGNPSRGDVSFPTFRQKDWYQGSSWASGIAVSPLNGRNQESSSEAIASYEAIALFGMAMKIAWKDHNQQNEAVATEIQNYGELLAASELRSADRYWHVIEASKRRQYPVQYKENVVGMLWNMMAQFQTWFGSAPYLAIGIQLLPLTAVSEERDTMEWVRELYVPFHESCQQDYKTCREQGWSVLVLAVLATVGHRDQAIEQALEIPSGAFTSAGGNGHSLTNTLWYLATRPDVIDPLVIHPDKKATEHPDAADDHTPETKKNDSKGVKPSVPEGFDCSCPKTCNAQALDRFAIGHTCRDRIVWLMVNKDRKEWDACHEIGSEFPGHCAACDPRVCSSEEEKHSKVCPPCSKEVCNSKLNLCPVENAPFLCIEGPSTGGCSLSPWTLQRGICDECCELSRGCED